jgi:hypothetical protein
MSTPQIERPDELEAGPALDRLIAEKVMGLVGCPAWHYINFGSAGGPALMNEGCEHDGNCYPAFSDRRGEELTGPPHYSTDIKGAWAVVEKLVSLGLDVTLDREGPICEVLVWKDAEPIAKEITNSNPATPALAICLAAIRVAEVAP